MRDFVRSGLRDGTALRCPNCGYDVRLHEMFSPARCPVVRINFPAFGDMATYCDVTPESQSEDRNQSKGNP